MHIYINTIEEHTYQTIHTYKCYKSKHELSGTFKYPVKVIFPFFSFCSERPVIGKRNMYTFNYIKIHCFYDISLSLFATFVFRLVTFSA